VGGEWGGGRWAVQAARQPPGSAACKCPSCVRPGQVSLKACLPASPACPFTDCFLCPCLLALPAGVAKSYTLEAGQDGSQTLQTDGINIRGVWASQVGWVCEWVGGRQAGRRPGRRPSGWLPLSPAPKGQGIPPSYRSARSLFVLQSLPSH
jgi:hypothetical protein